MNVNEDLSESAALFLEDCRVLQGLSIHTLRAYKQDLRDFAHYCGTLSSEAALDSMSCDQARLIGYVTYLQDSRKLKRTSMRRRLACLKRFYSWAEQRGLIDITPFHGFELRLRPPKRLPSSLSREQVAALVDSAEKRAAPTNEETNPVSLSDSCGASPTSYSKSTRLVVLLLVATGIRVGEMEQLTLASVDTSEGSIRVFGKGSRERTVFVVNSNLLAELHAYWQARREMADGLGAALFVNSRGTPLTAQALRMRLKRLARKAGLDRNITPHVLRHTAATLLVESGVDIRFIQRLLGHASIATTEIYTHVSDRSLKEVLSRCQ